MPDMTSAFVPKSVPVRSIGRYKPNKSITYQSQSGIENPRVGGSIPPLGTIPSTTQRFFACGKTALRLAPSDDRGLLTPRKNVSGAFSNELGLTQFRIFEIVLQ
jgi:hypothetical protein